VKKSGGALLLALKIDHDAEKPLSTQLLVALREIILSGGLPAGVRLPATRTMARDLGVSRTTVVEAFERLVAEGLIVSRTGAGSFVSQALLGHSPAPPRATKRAKSRPRLARAIDRGSSAFFERLPHIPRAFTTALPAFDAFPMALWSRQVAKHWRARRDVVLGYGSAQGSPALRRAIAAHLRANRGISCEPEQIFITNGAQHGFQLISSMLLDPGDEVWFENPGAIGARNCFAAAGAKLVPVSVDAEGLVVEEGMRRAPRFRLAFVTPSHQQPLGSTMSLSRRFALLAAAEAADAWIIEDDYDGEFCYRGHPPPTLKSFDTSGRVIYVGTFSKTLFPALRLGYFLAPPALVETFERFMEAFFPGVPSNPQNVVADFMDEGHFSTHIRRMRRLYAERQQALQDAAAARLAGLVDVVPTDTGLHTVGRLACDVTEKAVAEAAWERNITVSPLSRYCLAPIAERAIVLGFSGVRPDEIKAGVDVLGAVTEHLLRRRGRARNLTPPAAASPRSPGGRLRRAACPSAAD
jgi:GntR family transcriptional regulator/MocR family aminotransferase